MWLSFTIKSCYLTTQSQIPGPTLHICNQIKMHPGGLYLSSLPPTFHSREQVYCVKAEPSRETLATHRCVVQRPRLPYPHKSRRWWLTSGSSVVHCKGSQPFCWRTGPHFNCLAHRYIRGRWADYKRKELCKDACSESDGDTGGGTYV